MKNKGRSQWNKENIQQKKSSNATVTALRRLIKLILTESSKTDESYENELISSNENENRISLKILQTFKTYVYIIIIKSKNSYEWPKCWGRKKTQKYNLFDTKRNRKLAHMYV